MHVNSPVNANSHARDFISDSRRTSVCQPTARALKEISSQRMHAKSATYTNSIMIKFASKQILHGRMLYLCKILNSFDFALKRIFIIATPECPLPRRVLNRLTGGLCWFCVAGCIIFRRLLPQCSHRLTCLQRFLGDGCPVGLQ